MRSSAQQTEPQLLEIAALGYGAVLVIAVIAVFAFADTESLIWLWSLGPLGAVILAVATRARPIVCTAIGACLALGLAALFSIGLIVLQIAACLIAWWALSSRRAGRPVIIWSDLPWEAAGFAAIVIPLVIM